MCGAQQHLPAWEFFQLSREFDDANSVSCQCGGNHEPISSISAWKSGWKPRLESDLPLGYDGMDYANGEDPYLHYHPGILECIPEEAEVPWTLPKDVSTVRFQKKRQHGCTYTSTKKSSSRKNGKNGRGTRSVRKGKRSMM